MNKRVDLDGTYCIDIDDYNWILKKQVLIQDVRKDGRPAKGAGQMRVITLGYFPSLLSALRMYADNLEKDGITRAARPVSARELQTILVGIESACSALKLVEKDG